MNPCCTKMKTGWSSRKHYDLHGTYVIISANDDCTYPCNSTMDGLSNL